MEGTNRELTVEERTWAAQQIALVVGATEADALPLADFLLGVDNPNELQGQLLDMLGESPMALNFSSELIAKRFPPAKQGPAPLLPPRNGNGSGPQHSSLSRPQSQLSTRGGPQPTEPSASGIVAYRKADSSQGASTPSRQQIEPTVSNAAGDEQPVQQKSIRQLKKERQQSIKLQKEHEKKRQERANRKRVRCECQASEHPLLTNCLTCGRIICDSEGPGPCMFCGSEVESPDQQLQQHMRRLLRHSEQAEGDGGNDKQSSKNKPPYRARKTGMSYSMKVGGGMSTPEAALLWDVPPEDSNGKPDTSSATDSRGEELSEEEYLQLAFKSLGIDDQTTDPKALQEAESWVKATRRKERLLDYDRTAAQRTKLIDQLSDFDPFAVGKWMSSEEKIEAEKRKAERIKEEEKREARLRSGMRVLHLDFQKGSVDFKRPEHEEELGISGSSASTAIGKKAAPSSEPKGKSGPRDRWNTAATTTDSQPERAATRTSNANGAFANNPLLGNKAAPRFVLTSEKTNDTNTGKKAKAKAKGKDNTIKKGTEEPEPGSSSSSTTQLPNENTNKEPQASKPDEMARRRQMLRIQTNTDEELFI
ncbi:hypothetical protein GGI23_001169 [Coemansia sp. RSA 2559]|nr:hypothetical protein GGI23_001169 [Coemansia sp. RSA 2559]